MNKVDIMDERVQKELDTRIQEGVRNLHVSPLFEAGKTYNLQTQLEDEDGTLSPEVSHCWLTWQSKYFSEDEQQSKWTKQAFMFSSVAGAEEAKAYLEKHAIK